MHIGYARVSTQDQHLDLQIDALKAVGCEKIYQEKVTGKSRERIELNSCLNALRSGDVFVVWKLDRLARSLTDLVEIVHGLERIGVGFKSITESIDTTSPSGRLIFHLFGALAEFEHAIIKERTIAGLNAARARGRKGGRKPSLSKSDVKKAMAMLLDPKITKTEVAEHFKVSRITLNKAINREQENQEDGN